MALFTINGKEHELKLNYAAVERLNKLYEGGAYEFLGKAMMGDTETFPHIVHAGLLHTGENYSLNQVKDAIGQAVEEERLDLDSVIKLSNEVATGSFFYKKTVEKLLAEKPEAKKALEAMLK